MNVSLYLCKMSFCIIWFTTFFSVFPFGIKVHFYVYFMGVVKCYNLGFYEGSLSAFFLLRTSYIFGLAYRLMNVILKVMLLLFLNSSF